MTFLLALSLLAYSWLAFTLGRAHERNSRSRAAYRRAVAAMREDPEFRAMATTARRRAEMRRLTVLRGGKGGRERGPFAVDGGLSGRRIA